GVQLQGVRGFRRGDRHLPDHQSRRRAAHAHAREEGARAGLHRRRRAWRRRPLMGGFDFGAITNEATLRYLFVDGMTFTITLTLIAMAGGIFFGTLLAMMRLGSFKPLAMLAGGYVNLMRSLPLVLVIFWFFFLVPYIGAWV